MHMGQYSHLCLEERECLYGFLKQGVSLRSIAKKLGRSQSSVTRELQRNVKYGNEYFGNTYLPCKAQELSKKRALKQRLKAPLKNPAIFLYVRKHLREDGWSPEVIAGRIRIDHPGLSICHETIYQYIYSRRRKTRGMHLEQYLVLRRKKRMKHNGRSVQRISKIPEAVSIDLRPLSVLLRHTRGHWETDTVIGKQSDQSALSVTVERVTRVTLLNKLPERTALVKTTSVITRMMRLPKVYRKTITADNGAENTNHKEIAALTGMHMYFCHAYHSWEKGTVENTNGRIRRYIPNGISIDTIPKKYIKALEYKLNTTPRKCLQYLTPYEKMRKLHITITK